MYRGGLVLEVIGYIGRILIHNNPFTKKPFLVYGHVLAAIKSCLHTFIYRKYTHRYLICLTIGPAFLSASIYLCLSRIIVVYGERISCFRPRMYTITFISCDFISLLLQAISGALASTADTQSNLDRGTNIMVAGLSF